MVGLNLGSKLTNNYPVSRPYDRAMVSCEDFEENCHDGTEFDGILPKGPYPPCLRMADRALLAGYPRIVDVSFTKTQSGSIDTYMCQGFVIMFSTLYLTRPLSEHR